MKAKFWILTLFKFIDSWVKHNNQKYYNYMQKCFYKKTKKEILFRQWLTNLFNFCYYTIFTSE